MVPPTVAEAEALIGTESDSFCKLLINNFKVAYLFFKLVRWMFNADLTPTVEFKQFICQTLADCPAEEEEV